MPGGCRDFARDPGSFWAHLEGGWWHPPARSPLWIWESSFFSPLDVSIRSSIFHKITAPIFTIPHVLRRTFPPSPSHWEVESISSPLDLESTFLIATKNKIWQKWCCLSSQVWTMAIHLLPGSIFCEAHHWSPVTRLWETPDYKERPHIDVLARAPVKVTVNIHCQT